MIKIKVVVKIAVFVLLVGGLGFVGCKIYKIDKNLQVLSDTIQYWDVKYVK